MNKIHLLIVLSASYVTISAQGVGIGVSYPDPSAALEIKVTGKGLLIPRTSTVNRTGIISPAKGLIVYDTTTSSFWYHTGVTWTEIGSASGNGWTLTGNTGTNSATNYIGTADQQSLVFKVNNIFSGLIDNSTYNTGTRNTAFGQTALAFNSSGADNSAMGYGALHSNQTGSYNVAFGKYSLYNSDANYNTGYGFNTMFFNTTGAYNTATGAVALQNNMGGQQNTATGYAALYSDNGGSYNSAHGVAALNSNIGGSYNTANGAYAMYLNQTGYSNVAIGASALYNNTDRSNLVAIGDSALFNNGIGVGYASDASYNTAIGSKALCYNTTGYGNTANGYHALYKNTTGEGNTAIGRETLSFNNTGGANTAIGEGALAQSEAVGNTCIGYRALYSNSTGAYNTASGFNALSTNHEGSGNTALGYFADVSSVSLTNATVIGSDAIVNSSNKVRIGNSSITVIEGQVDWSFPSDGRFKTNITETVKGLNFIMKLRPVIYNFQTKKYDDFIKQDMPKRNAQFAVSQDFSESESIRHSGFVAQEVEKAAKEAGYDFNGIIAPKNEKQTYSLSYSQFVVPLVKAVQEQQAIIEDQNKKIDLQQQQMNALLKEIQLIKDKLK